jgi:hypothetical protein
MAVFLLVEKYFNISYVHIVIIPLDWLAIVSPFASFFPPLRVYSDMATGILICFLFEGSRIVELLPLRL